MSEGLKSEGWIPGLAVAIIGTIIVLALFLLGVP